MFRKRGSQGVCAPRPARSTSAPPAPTLLASAAAEVDRPLVGVDVLDGVRVDEGDLARPVTVLVLLSPLEVDDVLGQRTPLGEDHDAVGGFREVGVEGDQAVFEPLQLEEDRALAFFAGTLGVHETEDRFFGDDDLGSLLELERSQFHVSDLSQND
ncbi:hypothetical protein C0581_01705 [Candidatus Parcubacteria bacterium]|nr:MAG: hypothetical protein C0581_01705 [Candidatus Parcubacteria bacterium]